MIDRSTMPAELVAEGSRPDPLSEALKGFTSRCQRIRQLDFEAPWAFSAADASPAFYAVHEGSCQLILDGHEPPTMLSSGDLAVVTHPVAHRLHDGAGGHTGPLDPRPRCHGPSPSAEGPTKQHVTRLTVCQFARWQPYPAMLESALPPAVRVRGPNGRTPPWLEEILALMSRGSGLPAQGAQAILDRLTQIVFIQAVRVFLSELPENAQHRVRELLDPDIGTALSLIHCNPAEPWTVASLASRVSMSRSAFAVHFARLVGMSPIQYVTENRMRTACRLLRDPSVGLSRVASQVGYRSAAAFSNAFKRWAGVAPGTYRRRTGPA